MSQKEFDFDHWSQLAQSDPVAFFAARERLISNFIASAPLEHRQALTEMQRMIDHTRAQAGTPMKAVRQMMGMMADHLDAMRMQLEQLRNESAVLAGHLDRFED